jgi:hypothetical protein
VAVTRHQPFVGSIAAESIVVLGIETFARPSHGHTGVALGKMAFGAVSAPCASEVAENRHATRDESNRSL